MRLAVHLEGHVQGQATERAWLGLVRVSSGDGASDIGFALLAVLDRASSPSKWATMPGGGSPSGLFS